MFQNQNSKIGRIEVALRFVKYTVIVLIIPLLNGCLSNCNFITGYCR